MPNGYRYLERWNFLQNEPALDEGWIDEAEARERFQTRSSGFSFVNAEAGDGTVVPEFVIVASVESLLRFRCQFLNPAGSVTRVIDYKDVDGRLFKEQVIDYRYPDDKNRYPLRASTLTYTGVFETNGYGAVVINDKSQPTAQTREYRDVPVEGNWMPVPAFGEWENLTKPDYEAPEVSRQQPSEPA